MAGFREFQTGEVLTAANVNDFLGKQSVMKFADASARDTALGTAVGGSNALREGMVAYLDDTDDVQVYNGTAWSGVGYRYAGTRYYTSSGTFAKADPLGTGDIGLRAIRVRMVGGGGGSGGAETTGASEQAIGGAGAGGTYAESFITNIAGLASSETVTRGSGGAGGAAGANAGSNGGSSSFGSVVIANGGGGGGAGVASASFGGLSGPIITVSSTGDLVIGGGHPSVSRARIERFDRGMTAAGGGSVLGGSNISVNAGGDNGREGLEYGGGASSAINAQNQGLARAGGAGANGIVIVDCYV